MNLQTEKHKQKGKGEQRENRRKWLTRKLKDLPAEDGEAKKESPASDEEGEKEAKSD